MVRKRKPSKKWGKIGAPHSAKRKRFLARVRATRKGVVLKRRASGRKKRK